MDFDEVADELYGLDPAEFTRARDRYAREATKSGDRALGERIRRLRRPTRGAWLANLLVRAQPEQTRQLLELGRAMRQAQSDLAGPRLRELTTRRQQLLADTVHQTHQAATAAGAHPTADQLEELEQTLRAALADDQAAGAFASGRLTAPLRPGLALPTVPAPEPSPPAPSRSRARARATRPDERAQAEQRGQAQTEARRAVAAAERALRSAEAAAERADRRLATAVGDRERAQERAGQAEQALRDAQQRLEQTGQAERDRRADSAAAREQADAARRNLDEAQQALRSVLGT